MELIKWTPVERKRNRKISYTSPDYIRGYDLDLDDFQILVAEFNRRRLDRAEEMRLLDHVLTVMEIVLENPKINPHPEEVDALTDAMFVDAWGALRYVKPGYVPYSYVYRSAFTAACRFFKRKISERRKEEAIEDHLAEVFGEYMGEISDHRKRCPEDE